MRVDNPSAAKSHVAQSALNKAVLFEISCEAASEHGNETPLEMTNEIQILLDDSVDVKERGVVFVCLR